MAEAPVPVRSNYGYQYKLTRAWTWYAALNIDQRHALPGYPDENRIELMTGERYCRFQVPFGLGRQNWTCGAIKNTVNSVRDHVRSHQTQGQQTVNSQPSEAVTLRQWHIIRREADDQSIFSKMLILTGFFTQLYRQARAANPSVFPDVPELNGQLDMNDLPIPSGNDDEDENDLEDDNELEDDDDEVPGADDEWEGFPDDEDDVWEGFDD